MELEERLAYYALYGYEIPFRKHYRSSLNVESIIPHLVRGGHLHIVRSLGQLVELRFSDMAMILTEAIRSGHLLIVKYGMGFGLHLCRYHMEEAILHDRHSVLSYLLQRQNWRFQLQPLITLAIERNKFDAVKIICLHNASLETSALDYDYILSGAVRCGHTEIIRYLGDYAVDFHRTLAVAIRIRSREWLQYFLHLGGTPSITTLNRCLLWEVEMKESMFLEYLLDQGANNLNDALVKAISLNSFCHIPTLINQGVEVRRYHYILARNRKHSEIQDYLFPLLSARQQRKMRLRR